MNLKGTTCYRVVLKPLKQFSPSVITKFAELTKIIKNYWFRILSHNQASLKLGIHPYRNFFALPFTYRN